MDNIPNLVEAAHKEKGTRFYGFSTSNGEFLSRAGYDSAEEFMQHLENANAPNAPLERAHRVAEIVNVDVHGPVKEIDKLVKALEVHPWPVTYWSNADGTDTFFQPQHYSTSISASVPDSGVSARVHWNVKDNRFVTKEVPEFTARTKKESSNRYYGFAQHGAANVMLSREGYTSAQGFLLHLKNVARTLEAAQESADISNIEMYGPAAELQKLRVPLKNLSHLVTYWDTIDGAFYVPAKYGYDQTKEAQIAIDHPTVHGL
jgi:hypothetical protein